MAPAAATRHAGLGWGRLARGRSSEGPSPRRGRPLVAVATSWPGRRESPMLNGKRKPRSAARAGAGRTVPPARAWNPGRPDGHRPGQHRRTRSCRPIAPGPSASRRSGRPAGGGAGFCVGRTSATSTATASTTSSSARRRSPARRRTLPIIVLGTGGTSQAYLVFGSSQTSTPATSTSLSLAPQQRVGDLSQLGNRGARRTRSTASPASPSTA